MRVISFAAAQCVSAAGPFLGSYAGFNPAYCVSVYWFISLLLASSTVRISFALRTSTSRPFRPSCLSPCGGVGGVFFSPFFVCPFPGIQCRLSMSIPPDVIRLIRLTGWRLTPLFIFFTHAWVCIVLGKGCQPVSRQPLPSILRLAFTSSTFFRYDRPRNRGQLTYLAREIE